MLLIAIMVSRVEAATLACMLEAHGIAVHIGGFWHASVEVNTIALGGHRIYVAAADYRVASDLIREAGSDNNWEFSFAARRAVLRFLLIPVGLTAASVISGIALGVLPALALLQVPLAALGVPVNPQGRPDFFLAGEDPD